MSDDIDRISDLLKRAPFDDTSDEGTAPPVHPPTRERSSLAASRLSQPSMAAQPIMPHDTLPHIFEAIRPNAPFMVELAIRASLRASPIDAPMKRPHRAIISREHDQYAVKPSSVPELAWPTGHRVLGGEALSYPDFSRQVRARAGLLVDLRVLDVVDDLGPRGCRAVLRAAPNLEVVRFIPFHLPFSSRVWELHVPKVVVFADFPMPPAGTGPRGFFTLRPLVHLTKRSRVQTLVVNVSFMEDDHPKAEEIDWNPPPSSDVARTHLTLIFGGENKRKAMREHQVAQVAAQSDAPKARLEGIISALREWSWRVSDTPGRTMTIVGIEAVGSEILDPTDYVKEPGTPADAIKAALSGRSLYVSKPIWKDEGRWEDGTWGYAITLKFSTAEGYSQTMAHAAFVAETERE